MNARCPDTRSEVPNLCGGEWNRTTRLDRNRQAKKSSEKAVLVSKGGFPRVLFRDF